MAIATMKEFYEIIGGGYAVAAKRLPSERILKKFAMKFANDTSFADTAAAIEAEDWFNAFRASHTLKGVTLNMNFEKLMNSSSELTEFLRPSNYGEASKPDYKPVYEQGVDAVKVKALFENVKADYETVIAAVSQLEA
ncbi:MAG: Hpt domain-containing protein [Selenomonadaceae bacterium]|nr:Hpt domain-containing protein [Selenomonadaceae bacterium]